MQHRRAQILDAAYNLVGANGMEALNARSVANEVGINHATVHYYFPTRKDLVLALADSMVERLARDRSRFPTEGTEAERIEASLALVEFYATDDLKWLSCLIALTNETPSVPQLAPKLADTWNAWRNAVRLEPSDSGSKFGQDTLVALTLGVLLARRLNPTFEVATALDEVFNYLVDHS